MRIRFCAAALHRVGQLLTIEDVEIAALARRCAGADHEPFPGWPLPRFLTGPNGGLTLHPLHGRVTTHKKNLVGPPFQTCPTTITLLPLATAALPSHSTLS